MSDEHKAVFLSYASQDAEAAKRICDALRQAGVEVWFDQSELRGGDAWDAKIKKQIKECALFVPIISANTQARSEGYFRLEWKLAVDRSHLMADDSHFLFPVVIDDTPDATARVPDKFRDVQWTRLRLDETPSELAARVARLLSREQGAGSAEHGSEGREERTRRRDRPAWVRKVSTIGGLAIGLIYAIRPLLLPEKSPGVKPAAAAVAPAPTPPAAVTSPAPLAEAQKLVAQARKIYEDGDELNRDNLYLAEELVQRAFALNPVEPSAWELAAWFSYTMVWHSIEDTQARRETLLRQANRAVALAPDSVAAQLVFANAQLAGRYGGSGVSQGRFAEIEASLKQLAEREPQNWKIQRALGTVYRLTNRMDEAIRTLNRAIELSGGHPMATADLVNLLIRRDRYAEAEALLARALAHHRSGRILTFSLLVKCRWRGDFESAAKDIADWPEWLLQQDRGIAVAWQAALWARQPDLALRLVQQFPRQYVRDLTFSGPRAVLSARAQELAGNTVAAQADWRAVLQQCDQDLAVSASDVTALYWKAWALARLGDQPGAQAAATLLRQRLQTVQNNYILSYTAAALWATVGWADVAISALRSVLEKPTDNFSLTRAYLEAEPAFDPIRQDPHFRELIELAPAPQSTAAIAPKVEEKSVAVLPFENRSAEGEDAAFFADGIQEDLINTLSRLPGLKVIARTAVLPYRGGTLAPPQIARELGVTHLVEAGVQRAGDRVRLNVQLVRASDGEAVWSERYDRSLSATNIFDLQEEITQAVAKTLQLQLGTKAGAKLLTGTTGNLAAYEVFLKARNEISQGSAPEAVRLLQEAVRLDPNYALAHGALAEAYVAMGNGGFMPSAEAFPLARSSAERALELDEYIVQAYTALAEYAFHYEWNWAEAVKSMLRALAIDPNYANAYARHAGHLAAWGRFAEARAAAQRAAELLSKRKNFSALAMISLSEQRYQEVLDLTADQVSSDSPAILLMRGNALFNTGHQTEGLERLERLAKLHPDMTTFQANLGWAYAQAGQTARAREIVQLLQPTAKGRYVSPLEVAQVAAGLNDRDLAFAQLEKAFDQRDPNLPFIGNDTTYIPIRDDPRFRDLLKRLKLDQFFPAEAKK